VFCAYIPQEIGIRFCTAALEPVCNEYDKLQNDYHVEKELRSHAEKYASRVIVSALYLLVKTSSVLYLTIDARYFVILLSTMR